MTRATVGIDLGTSSVKVVALSTEGALLASSQVHYGVDRPRTGWAEQDPENWWSAACEAVRAALADPAPQVVSVGVSGQMHGLVALDADGRPVRPAIIWSDTRSRAQVDAWSERITPERVEHLTGMPIAAGMLGVSLSWVRDEEPDVYGRIRHVMSPKDYLRYRLTGRIATEPTDAAGGLLFDLRSGEPSVEIADAVGLDAGLLAPVGETLGVAGQVTALAATETTIPAGTAVASGGGDQAMAALALGLSDSRRAAVAISSGGTVFRRAAEPADVPRGLHLMPYVEPAQWLGMGVVLAAGLAIDWLSATMLGRPSTPASITALMTAADAVPAGSAGLLASPHLGGTRTPLVDDRARAFFVGLGFEHDSAHMARALVEGVCISLSDALHGMDAVGSVAEEIVVSGGGARFDVWRRTLADVTGLPVHVSADLEHSALGAALAGARAAGVDIDFTPADRVALTIEPDAAAHTTYRDVAERLRRTTRAAGPELTS